MGLGFARYFAVVAGWEEHIDATLSEAEQLAHKGLSFDSALAEAHALLGFIYLHRRQYERGLGELDRALEINPSDAESLFGRGSLLMWAGRSGEAIPALETALRYDPTNELAAINYAFALYLARRYDDAVRVLERTLKPGSGRVVRVNGSVMLIAALGQLGRTADAKAAADGLYKLWPFFSGQRFAEQFQNPTDRAHVLDGLTKAGLK